jgi:hypothetical protein
MNSTSIKELRKLCKNICHLMEDMRALTIHTKMAPVLLCCALSYFISAGYARLLTCSEDGLHAFSPAQRTGFTRSHLLRGRAASLLTCSEGRLYVLSMHRGRAVRFPTCSEVDLRAFSTPSGWLHAFWLAKRACCKPFHLKVGRAVCFLALRALCKLSQLL